MKANRTNGSDDRESNERTASADGGIIVAGDEGVLLEEDGEDDRPDNCQCRAGDGLACFPCYRAGFDDVNPDAPEREVSA